jgi:hypothetical protein
MPGDDVAGVEELRRLRTGADAGQVPVVTISPGNSVMNCETWKCTSPSKIMVRSSGLAALAR